MSVRSRLATRGPRSSKASKVAPLKKPQPEKPRPPRLCIVLPFASIGSDPEQDMATESLTTDLSHMRGMLVIGRNPAFAY